jgi:HEAT repeat protein
MTRFGPFLLPCALLAIASPAPVLASTPAATPTEFVALAQAAAPAKATPAQPQPAKPGTATPGTATPARPGAPAPAAPAVPTQTKPATPGTASPSPEPPPGQAVAPEALTAAIDKLGSLDFPLRTQASRTVRRAPAAQAVPALSKAVAAHKDGYVRFRALVLLAGFSAEAAQAPMRAALDDPNDRLREVAYAYFEQHPDPALATALLAKLDKEESEFVRPSLIRALAALGTDPKVQQALLREVNRGQDFFRSSVIEALGAQKAVYALTALQTIAKQDGPLQEDAVIALGRIGDKRALDTISAQQRNAPRNRQPSLAAAICLLGVNCESHERFLWETIKFAIANPGFQDLIRSSARGLAQLAIIGRPNAWATLIEQGAPSVDPARAPIAIAFASAAVTRPEEALTALQKSADQKGALSLLRDGFDMLEEDYGEEQFYVTIRRAYWKLPADGADRKAAEALITTLEF